MPKLMKGLLGLVAVVLLALLALNFFSEDKSAKQTTTAPAKAPVVQQQTSEPAKPAATQEQQTEQKAPAYQKPQVAREFKDGVDYRTLSNQVLTDVNKDQIEVAEIFWYGCPHCYTLEPIVDSWKPSLEKDSVFLRRPGFFGPNIWQTHAQLYYTLRNMGIIEKVHDGIFNEVQNRRNLLRDADAMADFLNERYGVDKKAFIGEFNSFGVSNQMQQSFAKLKGYDLSGVPVIVIDGRYVIEPGMAGSLNNMPAIADYLIEKVRKERAAQSK